MNEEWLEKCFLNRRLRKSDDTVKRNLQLFFIERKKL